MSWVYLFVAGLLEVCWAIGLKYTEGFTRLGPSIFTVLSMITGFGCLSLALKHLPIGTAYAVWTGIGTIGVALIGMLYLGESKDPLRIICILFIVVGIIGLRWLSSH
jgi:quaternary ammonium compound-resistance protein SugE